MILIDGLEEKINNADYEATFANGGGLQIIWLRADSRDYILSEMKIGD